MHVAPVDVGAELDAGDELDAKLVRDGLRFGIGLDRVVVGDRERGEAVRVRLSHEVGGRETSVGGGRVRMKIGARHRGNNRRGSGVL